MLVKYEKRNYRGNEKIWVGAYLNLHNMSHWHIDDEIVFVKEGMATVSVNGVQYNISEGKSVFCQSGTLHYIRGSNDSLIYVFLFDNSLVEEITSRKMLKSPLLKNEYDLPTIYETIKEELKSQKMYYELKTNTMIIDLVIQIFRNENVLPNVEYQDKSLLNYKNLLNKIDENYEYISFKDAADYMGLSETYFSKLFKNISGMTFTQYLNIVRIERAIFMINGEEKLSITEIAMRSGYSSIRNFNRVFLKTTGYQPKNLPKNFQLESKPIKTTKISFDPTLHESKLLS